MTFEERVRSIVNFRDAYQHFDSEYHGTSVQQMDHNEQYVHTIYQGTSTPASITEQSDYDDFFQVLSVGSNIYIPVSMLNQASFTLYKNGFKYFIIPKAIAMLHVAGVLNILSKTSRVADIINFGGTPCLLLDEKDVKCAPEYNCDIREYAQNLPSKEQDAILEYNAYNQYPYGGRPKGAGSHYYFDILVSKISGNSFVINTLKPFVKPMDAARPELFVADYTVSELNPKGYPLQSLHNIVQTLDNNRAHIGLNFVQHTRRMRPVVNATTQPTVYDIVLQQLDMFLTLISRGLYPTSLNHAYELFIKNLAPPFTYIRRPISLFMSNKESKQFWESVVSDSAILYKYQSLYQAQVKTGIKAYEEDNTLRYNPRGVILDDITLAPNLEIQHPHIPNILERTASDGRHEFIYIQTFRSKKMGKMPDEYWNVTLGDIPAPAITDVEEGDMEFEENEDEPQGRVISVYLGIDNEPQLDIPEPKGKYTSINGVSFYSAHLKLFYNTFLYSLVVDSAQIELPRASLRDVRMLRDTLQGLTPLYYFYQHMSDYMYAILNDKRTMLDIFDFLPARIMINRSFEIGLPLHLQLARLKKRAEDKITRLDELIEVAKSINLS